MCAFVFVYLRHLVWFHIIDKPFHLSVALPVRISLQPATPCCTPQRGELVLFTRVGNSCASCWLTSHFDFSLELFLAFTWVSPSEVNVHNHRSYHHKAPESWRHGQSQVAQMLLARSHPARKAQFSSSEARKDQIMCVNWLRKRSWFFGSLRLDPFILFCVQYMDMYMFMCFFVVRYI